ncbi:RDD family protein [Planctomicrobium sp. SH668]|uniref:RDD family protein n=1 Tax=Planctomicrobium sp. SH668 TaxID=3448126 RepID=UPI003F5B8693
MPKIRCSGCEAVLNAPEQARGKVIACPKCATKIRVPDEGGSHPPAKPKPKSAAPKKAVADSHIDFGKLDLDQLRQEGMESGVCPYCAAEIDAEDPVCRSCGMNIEKGQMDAKEARRRSLKGADPNLFYSHAWKESWEFLKENIPLAIRTGWIWALFATMNATCTYMSLVYCKNWPTKAFWGGLAIISALGIFGWFLTMVMGIISVSIVKEKFRADRFYFDFFKAAAAGGRVIFWPLVVIGPFLPLFLLFYLYMLTSDPALAKDPKFCGGMILAAEALPFLVLPIALVHMTTRHPYKAWILWELLKLFGKNAGATLYFLFVGFIAFLPALAAAGGVFYMIGTLNPFVSEVVVGAPIGDAPATADAVQAWSPGITGKIALWFMGLVELGTDQNTLAYSAIKGLLNVAATAILLVPIAYIAAFPAIMVARMAGLFGFYRTHTLDMVQRIMPNEPATFWVRYLAHTVDLLFVPLTGFLVTSNPKTFMMQWGLTGVLLLTYFTSPATFPITLAVFVVFTSWHYWAVQESSQLKSTLGKDTFGLMVVTEDEKAMTLKTATAKWFLRNLWYFSGGIPFLMMVVNSNSQTLHDQVTKTKVVFKGDK